MILPDLNVLLYAADSTSLRHDASKAWLEKAVNGTEEIGLPWIVHLGFLRLTTSAKVFAQPMTVEESLEWLDQLWSAPTVVAMNPGKAHAGLLRHLLLTVGTGGNLTTDAHLAALALEHDARIVTGDRDFLRFPGLKVVFPY